MKKIQARPKGEALTGTQLKNDKIQKKQKASMSIKQENRTTHYKLLPNDTPLTLESLDNIRLNRLEFTQLTIQERESLKTLTYARFIINLYNTYDPSEQTKVLKKVKQDFNKIFKRKVKTDQEECLLAILLAEQLWREATHEFKDQSIQIEMSNLSLRIWLLDEKKLQKKYLFSRSKMGKIATPQTIDNIQEIEKNNNKVANYIQEQLLNYLQLPLPKKRTLLKESK